MKIPHEEIKRLRLQKNISQVDIADAAGMSRSAYISFEKNGSENLPLKSAIGIAKALDVPFGKLFEINETGSDIRESEKQIKELHEKVRDLEKRIKEKDITIEYFENKIKTISKKIIERIEEKPMHSLLWTQLENLKYAETEEETKVIEDVIAISKKRREGIYDFYLKEGIVTEEDIEETQKIIKQRVANTFKQIHQKYHNRDKG